MRRRFVAGIAVGTLLGCSIILVSLVVGVAATGTLSSGKVPASESGSNSVVSSTTSTATYSSGTVPENTYGSPTTAPRPSAGGNLEGFLQGAVSGSSSLGSLATQPAATDALVLLPLALAVLVGAALYRMAVRKDDLD